LDVPSPIVTSRTHSESKRGKGIFTFVHSSPARHLAGDQNFKVDIIIGRTSEIIMVRNQLYLYLYGYGIVDSGTNFTK
jgi:hypothetical protein